jgi:hypothetical protein
MTFTFLGYRRSRPEEAVGPGKRLTDRTGSSRLAELAVAPEPIPLAADLL